MNNTPEVPLCKACARFIHVNEQCGRARGRPDYVHGNPAKTTGAQIEREWESESHCGPSGKFFVPIVTTLDYADTMVKRDQLARHEGRPEHDMDVFGRHLKAGT